MPPAFPARLAVLRPGALGDVLAARGLIRFLRDAYPGAALVFLAPGERGRFFLRPGWADQVMDWERAETSWLFADSGAPPSGLASALAGCGLILSYAGAAEPERLRSRLAELAPGAALLLAESRPGPACRRPIGEWLTQTARDFCRQAGILPSGGEEDAAGRSPVRLRLAGAAEPADQEGIPYAVLHPGSGSPKKNWPLANYAELGRRLTAASRPDGPPLFRRLLVVSGEADGDLGERLAAGIPGAELRQSPPLEELAGILARARLYVGNDSGVSHLAAAVENRDGGHPRLACVFGPGDPEVWAPPGAVVLKAGPAMAGLSPAEAWRVVAGLAGA